MPARRRKRPARYQIPDPPVTPLTEPYSAATIHDRRQHTMTESFEERTDRRLDSVEHRLTAIEQTLHTVAEQTAMIPAAVGRLLELMGDFRHHQHDTGGPIYPLDPEG